MINKERFISYGLNVIFLSIIIYFIFIDNPDYVDHFQKKIDVLEITNDSLRKVNDSLDLTIQSKKDSILILDSSLKEKDIEIYDLIIKTNEKVNNVDSFSNDELQRFFTERYNSSSNKE